MNFLFIRVLDFFIFSLLYTQKFNQTGFYEAFCFSPETVVTFMLRREMRICDVLYNHIELKL